MKWRGPIVSDKNNPIKYIPKHIFNNSNVNSQLFSHVSNTINLGIWVSVSGTKK